MNIAQLIDRLQKMDPNMEVATYEGDAHEFTSDYGWECTDDDLQIQVFFKPQIDTRHNTINIGSFQENMKKMLAEGKD